VRLSSAMIAAATLALTASPHAPAVRRSGGTITVKVRSGTTGVPTAGVVVKVSGRSGQFLTDASGLAVIDNVTPGVRKVSLKMGGCDAKRSVEVAASANASMMVWLCGDQVRATHASGENIVASLGMNMIGANGSAACVRDEMRAGVGLVDLETNALPLGTCRGSIAILSANHAFTYVNDPAAMAWTGAQGDVVSVNVPATRLRVPIAFVAVHWTSDIEDAIKSVQLANAKSLLESSFAGLQLAGDKNGGGIPATRHATSAQAATIGDGCSQVAAIRAEPAIYKPERLNVYVVPEINGASAAGYTCVAEGGPEIIFLDAGRSLPFTLVHEIGHALGLVRPTWGHTNGLKGFYQTNDAEPLNVMAGTEALDPVYFSVSQVARMTMAAESWLNLPLADATTMRSRQTPGSAPLTVVCGCPETEARDDCTALQTDIKRPYPLQTPTTLVLACRVSVPASVNVVCPAVKTVDAQLFQGDQSAWGGAAWVSLTPAIVTVAPSTSLPKQGLLTGHAAGDGKVRVWGDGSFADMTVHVSGACS
jgi:hypothetical protein